MKLRSVVAIVAVHYTTIINAFSTTIPSSTTTISRTSSIISRRYNNSNLYSTKAELVSSQDAALGPDGFQSSRIR